VVRLWQDTPPGTPPIHQFISNEEDVPEILSKSEDDRWIPPSFSRYVAKTVPDATLTMIPDQGHFYHLAYAEETLRMIKP